MLANVTQVVIDGAWLVAALTALGAAIGAGIRFGVRGAVNTLMGYLKRRDDSEAAMRGLIEKSTTALVKMEGAINKQGDALVEIVREVRDNRHDTNELANVMGMRQELDRIREQRKLNHQEPHNNG